LAKAFHVSPFMPMTVAYDWRFKWGDQQQVIHMRLLEQTQLALEQLNTAQQSQPSPKLMFDATFSFRSAPLQRSTLWRMSWQYPLLPVLVVCRIYWHALRLYLKGVPFFKHPKKKIDATHDTPTPKQR
jgi:DUF1365 family protein